MKKILAVILLALAGFGSAFAFIDSYTINREKLPEAAQEMLSEYFPKAKVSNIKVDRHLLKKTDYDVKLTNGVKVEFSNSGKWTSVDCNKKAVPDDLVPLAVRKYVTKNYSGNKIVSITKKTASYLIGMSDGVKLKFNLLGQFKGIVTDEPSAED